MESTNNVLIENVEDIKTLEEAKKLLIILFERDKMYECFLALNEIETKIINGIIISDDDPTMTGEDLLKLLKEDKIIRLIYEDRVLEERCLQLLKEMDNSKADRDYHGIETWFKYEQEVKSITICGRTTVNADLLTVLAVLAEIDLMKTFISRFEDLHFLAQITPFRMLIQNKLKMPITISNREIILTGFGIVNKKEQTVLIPLRSVDHYLDNEIPAESHNYKRIIMNLGFFHLKFVNENQYIISNCYNVDPKVPVLPWFLLNVFIKEINYYILEGLKKQIESKDTKIRSIYEQRMEERKEFYSRVQDEILSVSNKDI
jgi:hypothetical protein